MRRFHQLEAAHRLHAQIEEGNVEALPVEKQHGVPVALGQGHVEPHGLKPHLEHLEDARIVVDHEGAPGAHGSPPLASTAGRPRRGSATTKQLPCPSSDSTLTRPPCASTSPLTMVRPRPEPPRPR